MTPSGFDDSAPNPASGARTRTYHGPVPDRTQVTPGGRPPGSGGPRLVPGFEFLDVLGRGGMGVVYLAREVALNRTVALKMVLGGHHADPKELARFVTEGQALAALNHPNIVPVYQA